MCESGTTVEFYELKDFLLYKNSLDIIHKYKASASNEFFCEYSIVFKLEIFFHTLHICVL
jgi:hypothetical protein